MIIMKIKRSIIIKKTCNLNKFILFNLIKLNLLNNLLYNESKINENGDWGLGIGDWG